MVRLHKMKVVEEDLCPACRVCQETWSHVVDDCPKFDAFRYRDFSPSDWHQLPDCLRLHGLAPPQPNQDKDEARAIIGDVQYALLDILTERMKSLPEALQPQPRWRS